MDLENETKWQELSDVFLSLRQNFERAAAMRAFFEEGNTKASVAAVSSSLFIPCAMLIRSSILESWSLSISRMLDAPSKDRYSFGRAAIILRKDLADIDFIQRNKFLLRFLALWDKVEKCERRKKLKGMRDNTIAHALNHLYTVDRADTQDLRKLHLASAYLIELLGRGTGFLEVSADAPYEVWKERVMFYWDHIRHS